MELKSSFLDYGAIEELDPSILDGFHAIFNRDVVLEVRVESSIAILTQ